MIIRRAFSDAQAYGYWHDTMPYDLALQLPPEPKVLITPGHFRHTEDINLWLRLNGPAIVWILGDEEGDCPFWDVCAPVWKQFPNPHRPYWPDRILPLGYTPDTRKYLQRLGMPLEKSGWFLSGQNTNDRRRQAFAALDHPGRSFPSDTFAGGIDFGTYITQLWASEWAPSPSGNVRADSFRMWEALEAGAVPILDATTPHFDLDVWPAALGNHPFPVVTHWHQAADILDGPAPMAEAGVWYTRYKRDLKTRLVDDWYELSETTWWPEPEDRITVVITASPLPSHPDFSILAETVESVRERLPGNEICIAFDGPRKPDPDYTEHIRRVAWHANQNWPETWLWYTGEWLHQAGTVKAVLPHLREAVLLMVEADTPLTGDIPWRKLATTLYTEDADIIRLHYDDSVHPEHQYLTRGMLRAHGLEFVKTVQYSQRPHLALRSTYDRLLGTISDSARTYIEDAVYGTVANSAWETWRPVIYAPQGGMKRSYHLDGRAGEEKGEFWT